MPRIIPFPVRVEVMVIEFEPVSILPCIIATFKALVLLFSVITLAAPLFIVRLLKFVVPVILASELPVN